MIGAGTLRGQQQKNEIDGLAVESLEIHRPVKPRERSEQPSEIGHLAVGNGDAITDRGRAELLALHEDFEDRALALPGQHRGARGKLVQHLLFVVDLKCRKDRVRGDQIGERHE
jgi:hypothetical protein